MDRPIDTADKALESRAVSPSHAVLVHEAGHAVAALALGFRLRDHAITFAPIESASTYIVTETPAESAGDDWFVRRAAVKLSGPGARMQAQGEDISPESLEGNPEYAEDYREAGQILLEYLRPSGLEFSQVDDKLHLCPLLKRAITLARECVRANASAIEAIVAAARDAETFSRAEVERALTKSDLRDCSAP